MRILEKAKFFWLFFFVLVIGCTNDNSTKQVEKPTVQSVQVPRFDADSAYSYVAQQVAFGPRVPNSEGHAQTRDWLIQQFESFGASVIRQDFKATAYTGERLNASNIIAQYNPDASKRIVLAAHWDTRPFADSELETERPNDPILGADDGGSGVGVLLEVARQLGDNPIDMGVDIVLFDAEDYGESGGEDETTWGLGSQHWSRNPHVNGYDARYGILLDMVGSKGARFPKEGFSVQFAGPIVDKIWRLANSMGYGNFFVNETAPAVLDDHYFVNTIAKIPMVDIINKPVNSKTGFGAYWHTHNDNMDIIEKRTLRAVGQVVLAITYREAGGTLN